MRRSNILFSSLFAGLIAISTSSAMAQSCDEMIDEIDQKLESTNISEEQKRQVMDLRDQGMGENTRAGGDCTTPLSQALAVLNGQ
jgi:hypothetical protein